MGLSSRRKEIREAAHVSKKFFHKAQSGWHRLTIALCSYTTISNSGSPLLHVAILQSHTRRGRVERNLTLVEGGAPTYWNSSNSSK